MNTRFPLVAKLLSSARALALCSLALGYGVATAASPDAVGAGNVEERFVEAVTLLRSPSDSDKAKAVKQLKAIAVGGHARSQRILGILYLNGFGVLKNEKQAYRWFEQATENQSPIALVSFCELLMDGVGGEQDYPRARTLMESMLSPNANYIVSPDDFGEFRQAKARANYLLGLIYLNGWGMEAPDKPGAIKKFEAAASGGERDATMYLAIAYAKGDPVEKSVKKAKEYFKLLDLQSSDAINREIENMFVGAGDTADAQNMKEASQEMGAVVTESIYAMQTEFAREILIDTSDEFDANMAASLLQMAVDGGYADAMVELGVLHYRGLGVEQDIDRARELFREAAETGWIIAQYNLGVMIDLGQAKEEPGFEKRKLWTNAADAGLYAAQVMLDRKGEPPGIVSSSEDLALGQKMADQNDPRALYSLAKRKLVGWGVEQETDIEKIAALLTRSAEGGNARAQYELGFMRIMGMGVPVDPVSGFSWLRSSAFQEFPPALDFMGTCYVQGLGVEQNAESAFSYFRKAADLGYNGAKINLAAFYLTGVVVGQDPWKASQLFLEAADEGNDQAAFNIGNCYLLGQGVRRDVQEGIKWLARSAELGNMRACFQLRNIYTDGLLVDPDEVEAGYWIERMAEFGESGAMKETAFNYYLGRGRPKNRGKALNWIEIYLAHPAPVDPAAMQLKGEYEDYNALKRLAPKDYSAMILMADLKAEKGWSGSDPKAAAAILNDLASKGFNGARLRLAKLNLKSDFPGASERKGFDLLKALYDQKKASRIQAERTYAAQAAFLMSRCYHDGVGAKASEAKALALLEEAASMGWSEAQYVLGRRLVAGEGMSVDIEKGANWLLQAARSGDKQSRLQLARLNLTTPLSMVSQASIVDWLKELVDQGSGEARMLLRKYGVRYKEAEYEEKELDEEDAEPEYDPWAPIGVG